MSKGAYNDRPCRTEPWLPPEAGGTYQWSSEKGTWSYKDQKLKLSDRTGTDD